MYHVDPRAALCVARGQSGSGCEDASIIALRLLIRPSLAHDHVQAVSIQARSTRCVDSIIYCVFTDSELIALQANPPLGNPGATHQTSVA